MSVELKKLNLGIVIKNGTEMCDLVISNRARLSPYGTKDVVVSKIPFKIAPVQVFIKNLTKGVYNGR